MAISNIEQAYIDRANEIKNETVPEANTAERVGGLFSDSLTYIFNKFTQENQEAEGVTIDVFRSGTQYARDLQNPVIVIFPNTTGELRLWALKPTALAPAKFRTTPNYSAGNEWKDIGITDVTQFDKVKNALQKTELAQTMEPAAVNNAPSMALFSVIIKALEDDITAAVSGLKSLRSYTEYFTVNDIQTDTEGARFVTLPFAYTSIDDIIIYTKAGTYRGIPFDDSDKSTKVIIPFTIADKYNGPDIVVNLTPDNDPAGVKTVIEVKWQTGIEGSGNGNGGSGEGITFTAPNQYYGTNLEGVEGVYALPGYINLNNYYSKGEVDQLISGINSGTMTGAQIVAAINALPTAEKLPKSAIKDLQPIVTGYTKTAVYETGTILYDSFGNYADVRSNFTASGNSLAHSDNVDNSPFSLITRAKEYRTTHAGAVNPQPGDAFAALAVTDFGNVTEKRILDYSGKNNITFSGNIERSFRSKDVILEINIAAGSYLQHTFDAGTFWGALPPQLQTTAFASATSARYKFAYLLNPDTNTWGYTWVQNWIDATATTPKDASATVKGVMKLYTDAAGGAIDGTITQAVAKAINDAVNASIIKIGLDRSTLPTEDKSSITNSIRELRAAMNLPALVHRYISTDGTNDYGTVPIIPANDLFATFGIVMKLRFTHASQRYVMAKSTGTTHFHILSTTGGRAEFGVSGSNRVQTDVMNNGAFHWIGFNYNAATTSINAAHNGIITGTKTNVGAGPTANTTPYYFGATSTPGAHGAFRFSDIRIYSNLTTQQLIDATLGARITAGLVGEYRFAEQAGTTAADTSGNDNPMTLFNGVTWGTENY